MMGRQVSSSVCTVTERADMTSLRPESKGLNAMLVPFHADNRRHVLLPFKADAFDIAPLRGAVASQLAEWGVSAIADSVTLAVSELATNVVCHVGAGTPAALFLESCGDRLRLEVYDTSPRLPSGEAPASDEETGRGLALVAAVSGGWHAAVTPAGKAVCCEFAVPTFSGRSRVGHRVARASEVVETYRLNGPYSSTPTPRSAVGHAVADAVVGNVITDLLHWLAANGRDPDTVLDFAQIRFEAEAASVVEARHVNP